MTEIEHRAKIPIEYQTDNLFLLIGTNPLPNLVAAKLLLKEGGILYLVCSADTSATAVRLEEVLAQSPGIGQFRRIEVPEAGAREIAHAVKSAVGRTKGSVGLHYTGGTKAMAVHAYRAIEAGMPQGSPSPVFSYLDATSFEMRVDPDWREKVLLEVKPTLEELLALHRITLKAGVAKNVILPETAAVLAQAAGDGGLPAWRSWCDNVLREQAYEGGSADWKRPAELRNIVLPLPDDPALLHAVTVLKSELGLPEDATELPLDPTQLRWPFGKQKLKYLCRWLDGTWLEYYVLSQVQGIADACELHSFGMTLSTDPDSSLFEFEFDVAALRGYQLFGISCTTDCGKGMGKSKLFEAYIRSRQLGGDEARVGLVCGYPDPGKLQGEIASKWDAEGRAVVFGPQHLPGLASHLTAWFKTAG